MIVSILGAGVAGYCAGKYLKIKVIKKKFKSPIIIKVRKKKK